MTELVDVISYLVQNYPHKSELSKARLTKMVYLSDWKFSVDNNKQMTQLNWFFDNYGPFVWDVIDAINESPNLFTVEETKNSFGAEKSLIILKNQNHNPKISASEKQVLDFVIESTKRLNWNEFINLVYSTYPILTSKRYTNLNLPNLAVEYKKKIKSAA